MRTPSDVERRLLCKIVMLLLLYPDRAWADRLPAIRAALDALPDSPERAALAGFLTAADAAPLAQRQVEYVDTFDLSSRSALYLTYHVFGDEKERQQTPQRGHALIQLGQAYAAHGFDLAPDELPDYLPVVLEFAAEAGSTPELVPYAPVLLTAIGKVLAALDERQSAYAPLLAVAKGALQAIWGVPASGAAEVDDPDDASHVAAPPAGAAIAGNDA